MMVLHKTLATGIRIEIAGVGNTVHKILFLAAEKQMGKEQSGIPVADLSMSFI